MTRRNVPSTLKTLERCYHGLRLYRGAEPAGDLPTLERLTIVDAVGRDSTIWTTNADGVAVLTACAGLCRTLAMALSLGPVAMRRAA